MAASYVGWAMSVYVGHVACNLSMGKRVAKCVVAWKERKQYNLWRDTAGLNRRRAGNASSQSALSELIRSISDCVAYGIMTTIQQ